MAAQKTTIPIYTTRGDAGAFLCYPYLFSGRGEWIGWVDTDRNVYSVTGSYVGWLTNDPRILRKRSFDSDQPNRVPPPPPLPLLIPAQVPLAPMMPELSFSVMDVLDEDPDLLSPYDFGVYGEDLN